ncbi:MAG: competence/damage-inducible protein A [Candidatus Xenobia bacterium]
MPRTAAIIVIGNEILTGKIVDENTPFLTRQLWDLGVSTRRVEVIPDEVGIIAAAVRDAAGQYDFVFTSGGVGPTHDDVTMEGIARAFSRGVCRHPELVRLLEQYFGGRPLSEAEGRLAEVPEGARLVVMNGMKYPQVVVENVYIFPGIPALLQKKFLAIRELFRDVPIVLRKLRVAGLETDLAGCLNTTVARYDEVAVGSYPQEVNGAWQVLITLECRDVGLLEAACQYLVSQLPQEALLPEQSDSVDLREA